MKIRVWSDLHIDGATFAEGENCRKMSSYHRDEILVLAGDTSNSAISTLQYANSFANKFHAIIVVLGNHEFYKGFPYSDVSDLKNIAIKNVHLLDKEAIQVSGITFIGATLWTDFNDDPRIELVAQRGINDFNLMYVSAHEKVTPLWMRKKHLEELEYIRQMTKVVKGPKVIITHFPPLREFQHPRWGSVNQNPLNAYFMTNNVEIYDWEFDAWICGHTHDGKQFEVAGKKFVCNPRGYAYRGEPENKDFDPNLILEI